MCPPKHVRISFPAHTLIPRYIANEFHIPWEITFCSIEMRLGSREGKFT